VGRKKEGQGEVKNKKITKALGRRSIDKQETSSDKEDNGKKKKRKVKKKTAQQRCSLTMNNAGFITVLQMGRSMDVGTFLLQTADREMYTLKNAGLF